MSDDKVSRREFLSKSSVAATGVVTVAAGDTAIAA